MFYVFYIFSLHLFVPEENVGDEYERLFVQHACTFQAFSALTLLIGHQEGHSACKNEWWGAGMVICLQRGADACGPADPLPLTVSCFSKIQIGFTFLVPAHLGSPLTGVCVHVLPVTQITMSKHC